MSDDRLAQVPDTLLRSTMENLRCQPLFLVVDRLKDVGRIAHVAGNASAKNSNTFTNVKNIQFKLIKICDAFGLVLQSFRTGSNDICQAVKLSILYIMDGFPDMAVSKMDTLQLTVKGMLDKVNAVSSLLAVTKQELGAARNDISNIKQEMTSEIELCFLTLEAADTQLKLLKEYADYMRPVVEGWLLEYQVEVLPKLKRNAQAAKKLSKSKQAEFWSRLQEEEGLVQYFARWEALALLCEDYNRSLSKCRNMVDLYYTSNPLPNEAIKQAWADADGLPITDGRFKTLLLRRKGVKVPASNVVVPSPSLPIVVSQSQVSVHGNDSQDEIMDFAAEPRRKRSNQDRPISRITKRVTKTFSNLKPVQSRLCGLAFLGSICGASRRNTHGDRFRKVQGCAARVNPDGKKNACKSLLRYLHENFAISMKRGSADVESSLRRLSQSLTEDAMKNVNIRAVSKALKKLRESANNLLENANNFVTKVGRDLGDSPKYVIAESDVDELTSLRLDIERVVTVVAGWLQHIENCAKKLADVKKMSPNDANYIVAVSAVRRDCVILRDMLIKQKTFDDVVKKPSEAEPEEQPGPSTNLSMQRSD